MIFLVFLFLLIPLNTSSSTQCSQWFQLVVDVGGIIFEYFTLFYYDHGNRKTMLREQIRLTRVPFFSKREPSHSGNIILQQSHLICRYLCFDHYLLKTSLSRDDLTKEGDNHLKNL